MIGLKPAKSKVTQDGVREKLLPFLRSPVGDKTEDFVSRRSINFSYRSFDP